MQNKLRDNCSVRLIVGGDYLFSRVYLIASISRFNASQVAIMLSKLSWILFAGWNSSRLGVNVNVVRSTAFPYNISAAVFMFMFFWGFLAWFAWSWVLFLVLVKSSHNEKLDFLFLHFQLASVSPHPRRV